MDEGLITAPPLTGYSDNTAYNANIGMQGNCAMNSAGTAIVMQAGTSAPFSGPVPPQQDTLPRPPSPYMAAIRLLSLALAFMGVLSCVAGGLGVHYVQYALDVAEWPTTSGSGAWCGSLAIVTGLLGFTVSFLKPERHNGTINFAKMMFYAYSLGIGITSSLASVNLDYSIKIWSDWTKDLQMWFCVGDYPNVVAMAAMNVGVALSMLALLLMHWMAFALVVRGMRSRHNVPTTTAHCQ